MQKILIWIVVAVAVVPLIGVMVKYQFSPSASSKIPNTVIINKSLGVQGPKIIVNGPLGIQRTKIMQQPGLPIKNASKIVKQEFGNLVRNKNLSANTKINSRS
ncbi:MAG: hypothetical protein DLM72_00065 [Candidatus Nitrosopolaris wilkensis]|nr:MAG: hypothetical protein DLM72_00065 [Candidatus Nitrosopolaris wilkensis]